LNKFEIYKTGKFRNL